MARSSALSSPSRPSTLLVRLCTARLAAAARSACATTGNLMTQRYALTGHGRACVGVHERCITYDLMGKCPEYTPKLAIS